MFLSSFTLLYISITKALKPVKMEKRKEKVKVESCSDVGAPTGEKRKVVGKEWEPNSFSSRYK